VKVHLTVNEALAATPEGRTALLEHLGHLGFACLNPERFARFGILTGEVSAEMVDRLREVDGVEAVERDQKKYAT
jgi:hypothetical protein